MPHRPAARIRNRDDLLSHGAAEVRRVALELVEAGLEAADPYPAVRALVSTHGDRIRVGDVEVGPEPGTRILFLGAGKASFPIAAALEDALGGRLDGGIVVCKEGQEGELERIRIRTAAHPYPDEAGLRAAREVADLARRTGPGDLVLCGITGGSSALLALPTPGVTLADLRNLTRLLLDSGAPIGEVNAVRKHVSRIKGGRLARMIHPAARLVNLTVSDVVGDPLDLITGPTVPDPSTLADARRALVRHGLWERVPASVRRVLSEVSGEGAREGKGAETRKRETPKELGERRFDTFVVVGGDAACRGALHRARDRGLAAEIHATDLEGESRAAGRTFAELARRIASSDGPLPSPCALVAGGETIVRLEGGRGVGGPNQEFALAAASGLAHLPGGREAVVVGLDTDGTDGPTPWAGGIVDTRTAARAREVGTDLEDRLRAHDAGGALESLDDLVVTGSTGTNVNDLKLLVVL